MREHLESINHAQAIEIIKDIAREDTEIDERMIKQNHSIILYGIDRDNARRYRNIPVMIIGSEHIPPQPYLIEPQMQAFIHEFHRKEEAKEHAVLIAAYLHNE